MVVKIGEKAPDLSVAKWFKGESRNISELSGSVILVQVFQVNCPGSIAYGLAPAVRLFEKYSNDGLKVIALSTAFEDYDKNNMETLGMLLSEGKLVGDTADRLHNFMELGEGNRLKLNIPFSVAMDVVEEKKLVIATEGGKDIPRICKKPITFSRYNLFGTPSYILIDRQGILRETGFGSESEKEIEKRIQELLREQ